MLPSWPRRRQPQAGSAYRCGAAIIRAAAEVEAAIGALASEGVGAVLIQPILVLDPNNRSRLITLALRHRLPTASGLVSFADAGGLLTYASEFKNTWRQAAVYVDKLLKGARAGDLPVDRPTTFSWSSTSGPPARWG
jgi:putative tryptophan/tyrosine transport system substrate-binding protein